LPRFRSARHSIEAAPYRLSPFVFTAKMDVDKLLQLTEDAVTSVGEGLPSFVTKTPPF